MRNSILTTPLRRGGKGAVFLCILFSAVSASVQSQTLPLDLIINGERVGTIQAQLPTMEDEEIRLLKEELMASLENELVEAARNKLTELTFEGEWLPLSALRDAGLEAEFRDNDLTVVVTVPLDFRPEKPLSVRDRAGAPPGEVTSPESFSAYLNVNGQADIVMQQPAFLFPYDVGGDAVFNIFGWVLQGGVLHGFEGEEESFYVEPSTLRLTKDFLQPQLRLVVGDLTYGTQGYQQSVPLQGVSLTKLYTLSSAPLYTEHGEQELIITSPSKVEVYFNEQKVETYHLSPGRYRVQDLYLQTGINRVKLVVTDNFGNTTVKEYAVPFDSRLVPKGKSRFSYALGIPEYSLEIPKISGFHAYGFDQGFTGGINFQLAFNQQMVGLNMILATVAGTFGLDAAVSNIQDIGFDFATRLLYRYQNPNIPGLPIFSLSGEYKGEDFGALGNTTPSNLYSFRVRGNVGFDLPLDFSLNIGPYFYVGREPTPDLFGFSFVGGRSFGQNTSLRFDFSFEFPKNNPFEWKGSIHLNASLPAMKSYVSVRQDVDNGKANITWTKRPEKSRNDVTLSTGLQGWPATSAWNQSVYASLDYSGYRFNAGITDQFSFQQPEEDTAEENTVEENGVEEYDISNRLNIRIGSALVFAKNRFAVSAPVNDSFVIIVPQGKAKEGLLGVNPSSDNTYEAISDWLGPPVLNQLQSYSYKSLFIEAPDLPIDYDLGRSYYTLFPTYRSGILVTVGTETSVYVQGVILGEDGKPLELMVAEARPVDDPEAEPVQFFTDRDGSFFLSNVKPGNYAVEIYAFPGKTFTFTVEENAEGSVNIGTIRLEATDETK